MKKGDGLPTTHGDIEDVELMQEFEDEIEGSDGLLRASKEANSGQDKGQKSDDSRASQKAGNWENFGKKIGKKMLPPDDRFRQYISNKVTCSKCHQNKSRIQIGISPNKKRKYYVDETGDQWAGKKCPDCRRASHADYMRRKRKADREGKPMELKKPAGGSSKADKMAQLFAPIKNDNEE